jgi:2-polyprenyl-6-methoxyphenol hydroxylase-like FAD-dependent oxidoreductase
MRRIAIVGSGQAGLVNAHSLLQAGYEVDFSDPRYLTDAHADVQHPVWT